MSFLVSNDCVLSGSGFVFLSLPLYFFQSLLSGCQTLALSPYQHRASSCVTNLGSIVFHAPKLVSDSIPVSLSVQKSKGKSASAKIELQSQNFISSPESKSFSIADWFG